MSIDIQDVSKNFGDFKALEEIRLSIKKGELVALLGPSGSGKTSLLRIIAGLESATKGSIHFNGNDMTNVNAVSRQVGFVFQHYALFSHMTVADNISYGLRVRPRKKRPSKNEIKQKVDELLGLVKLDGLQKRYPSQLSGGQRQRVALARALAVQPEVLLLDEPFGALDAKVRKELRRWLRNLHNQFDVTSIFVTHDQEEAMDVADRIVVMNQGRIEQIGTPDEVYENPNSPFVFDFLGNVNLFKGRVKEGNLKSGTITLRTSGSTKHEDKDVVGYIRPHQMQLHQSNIEGSFPIKISHIQPVGPIVFIEAEKLDEDETIDIELPKNEFTELGLKLGDVVYSKPKHVHVFSPEEFSI
ncbi:sulfate/molybdate ABC transporter ATP-binding protein [Alkalicoccobacillus plakortidis]|uniref:Sulfate/molybdate ABC transporter ATP-binding protein n=1 Tax=Alkalicoccobacillus plakortidis TaxID=444060 RepID=A0ABT0XF72_9BACI|nr:sulfate/molybdate ABC transporter ATP-binding protein [Alkalicoccobacillus plakortidis]MCM2674529.1 sulfate/molybdate ABC transporter ATP-binding protein [Alkalicoccobacillus plakortidis]